MTSDPGHRLLTRCFIVEETGIVLHRVGRHLWDRESVYLTRITDTRPTVRPKHRANEKAGLIEHRWWTHAELVVCGDILNGALREPLLLRV